MRDTAAPPIPFIDLQAQRARIGSEIDAGIARVMAHGAFVMGPEVIELESALAARAGAAHCLTCSSGTDALMIPLMAEDVGPGDAVFVPSFTFAATAEVPALRGAHPVFVDVDPDTFNMDAESLVRCIRAAQAEGLTPRVVISVDLFGQPADYDALIAAAQEHGLWLLDDAAQGYGASFKGQALGTFGRVTSTSFYPSKPLGCYGDGGAVFTDDDDLYARMKQVRVHGNGGGNGEIARLGLTARLDSIQAAILLAKLEIFDDECQRRNAVAERYNEGLKGFVKTPILTEGATSVWAQYTIVSPARDTIVESLAAEGIPTALFYPKPVHTQAPYQSFIRDPNGMAVTDSLAASVVSLPIHPYLDQETQDRIIAAVRTATGA